MNNNRKLKTTIGLSQAIALNVGAVLGSGILLIPSLSAQLSGPASIIAWGIMALFVIPMALSMGLLSTKFPNSGGVSHFVTLAFGEKIGALVGWFFLMSVTIGAPIVALIGAHYLGTAMRMNDREIFWLATGILALSMVINFFGMQIASKIQVAVMIAILLVLITTIIGSIPYMNKVNFVPFLPHGWLSVGQTMALLFWCFIGWEAVSHLSEEFKNPQKDGVRSVLLAAIIVGILYFFTAFTTVATHSYASGSEASLVILVTKTTGAFGGLIIGITGVFICIATLISYIGAASRLAYTLAKSGELPRWMGTLSEKHGTPIGGLIFLTFFFFMVMTIYGTGLLPLSTFIQLPNATFILTYLGGCAAGIKLLKNHRVGSMLSKISFLLTASILPFVGWALLYPLCITIAFFLFRKAFVPSTQYRKLG